MTDLLTSTEIARRLSSLPSWRLFDRALHARFEAPDFPAALDLVRAVGESAEQADHHPDIDIRWRTVSFELSTHSAGGITDLDTQLAGVISELSQAVGAVPVETSPQRVEIAVDSLQADRIRPFWSAVFAAEPMTMPDGAVELLPAAGGPRIWFQEMAAERAGRNRLHVDVYVPHEEVLGRLSAALAAGGRLVTEEFAPSWWVLADSDGNEVCLCVPDE